VPSSGVVKHIRDACTHLRDGVRLLRQSVTIPQRAAFVGLCASIVALISGGWRATPYNNQVLLAQAMLHGHLAIAWPGAYIDALPWHGQHYVIEGPLPAVLLLPFVALWGAATNQTLLGVALCGVAISAAWRLLTALGLPGARVGWLTLATFAGTDLWWCASLGDVWFIAHVAAFAATMLALAEIWGEGRSWLVALYGCAATAARFSMLGALPIEALLLVFVRRRSRSQVVVAYTIVVGLALCGDIAYNLARWGVPYDIGYTAWYHLDTAGSPTGSPFQLRYLPGELVAWFFALPIVVPHAPWLLSPMTGIGLPVTSPFLAFAFAARRPYPTVWLLWLATLLTAVPSLLYYVDGYDQFGMRHALDAEPFLIALTALALVSGPARWFTPLVLWSSAVGGWGVWYWHAVLGR